MFRILNKYRKLAVAGESGFTLVEQVVTVAILGLVLTAAMAALATGGLSLNIAASKNEAMSLAQRSMECVKNQSPLAAAYPACDQQDSGFKTSAVGSPPFNGVQKIDVTVSRGRVGNWVPFLVLEDLKVDRP